MRQNEKNPNWKQILDLVQSFLTCCGVIAAGWWFLFSAQAQGKATCSQSLSMVKVNSNMWWGCLEVKIENVGQRPLDLKESIFKLSQIKPVVKGYSLELNTNDYRVHWPQMIYRDDSLVDRILPGEADYKIFEFTIPTNVETFRVYSYLSLGKTKELGWSKVSIYTIRNDKAVLVEATED